eukprot:1132266-Prorocentrum_minimum.AAC.8
MLAPLLRLAPDPGLWLAAESPHSSLPNRARSDLPPTLARESPHDGASMARALSDAYAAECASIYAPRRATSSPPPRSTHLIGTHHHRLGVVP